MVRSFHMPFSRKTFSSGSPGRTLRLGTYTFARSDNHPNDIDQQGSNQYTKQWDLWQVNAQERIERILARTNETDDQARNRECEGIFIAAFLVKEAVFLERLHQAGQRPLLKGWRIRIMFSYTSAISKKWLAIVFHGLKLGNIRDPFGHSSARYPPFPMSYRTQSRSKE